MTTPAGERLVSWEEIRDIELVILRRMREYAPGAHQSVFSGSGFDLAGFRDWQPGDRPSAVDWPQSTLTNFSPLITREFEQESAAPVLIVADTSRSTRCGVGGAPIARVIARTVATLGLAAAFFQDVVGLVTMDGRTRRLEARPRTGRNHAVHCVDVYQASLSGADGRSAGGGDGDLAGLLRRRSLMPVVSDFLVPRPEPLFEEFATLGALHDVLLVMVDSAFAFELPPVSTGWVEACDAESGQRRLLAAGEVERLPDQVRDWQEQSAAAARRLGLDVVRVRAGDEHAALSGFLDSRRRRRR